MSTPRNKLPRWTWALIGLGALAACATAAELAFTGPKADRILFPHSTHARAKVECLTCHEGVYDAKDLTAAANSLPKEAKCLECHKQKKADGQCTFCHSEPSLAAAWPSRKPALKLDHAKHIELVKEDCTKCHSRLSEPLKEVPISDGHKACLSCHQHEEQFAQSACASCHVDLKKYPLQPLSELSHQGDFLRRHATAARAEGASCSACHEQNMCLDCHARTAMVSINTALPDRPDRSFIHRNDFFSRHQLDAKEDPASCVRCHGAGATSSCATCHKAQNIGASASNPRNPHPPGWGARGGVQFHGDAARRDIVSCASCHDQGAQSNCVQCHKSGGIGGDPHPVSFGSKHTLQEAKTNATCLACHR